MDSASGKVEGTRRQEERNRKSLQPLRDKINEPKLKEQEARINEENFTRQLEESAQSSKSWPRRWKGKRVPPRTRREINRLNAAIAELGAVNLAALAELEQAPSGRPSDAQSQDLNEAVATLEAAIKRIDRETRDLLQTTFDTVNKNFMELFPTLFGGGNAYLKLTGEEILDAACRCSRSRLARRTSRSSCSPAGREGVDRAVTVFSLFRLNPAPFCLLDEGGRCAAGRFQHRPLRDLVKKMSASPSSRSSPTMR